MSEEALLLVTLVFPEWKNSKSLTACKRVGIISAFVHFSCQMGTLHNEF